MANEIQTNFIYTVNKKSFEILNKTGYKLEKNKSEILGIKSTLESVNKSIVEIKEVIDDASKNSQSLEQYLKDTKDKLPVIKEDINNLQKATEASKNLVNKTEDNINSISKDINNDIMDRDNINNEINSKLIKLKEFNNTGNNSEMIKIINEVSSLYDSMNNNVNGTIKSLEIVNNLRHSKVIDKLIKSLGDLKEKINGQKNKLVELKTKISNVNSNKQNINQVIDSVLLLNDDIDKNIKNTSDVFYNETTRVIENTAEGLNKGVDKANNILDTIESIIPQLNALGNYGIGTSKAALKDRKKISDKLSEFQKTISKLQEKTISLTQENLDKIIELTEKNPEAIASFLSSPINIKEEEVYNTSIFGVGLTPFYTVLAIWVGVLLMSSLLTVEAEEFEGEKNTHIQVYFGKLMLFL